MEKFCSDSCIVAFCEQNLDQVDLTLNELTEVSFGKAILFAKVTYKLKFEMCNYSVFCIAIRLDSWMEGIFNKLQIEKR